MCSHRLWLSTVPSSTHSLSLELHISRLADKKRLPSNFVHLVLGDPGAASRHDAKFSGESLLQEQSALEVNFRSKLSHRLDSQKMGLRGCAHPVHLCELLCLR